MKLGYPKSCRRSSLSEEVKSENDSGVLLRDEGQHRAGHPEGDVRDDRRPTTTETVKRHVEEQTKN